MRLLVLTSGTKRIVLLLGIENHLVFNSSVQGIKFKTIIYIIGYFLIGLNIVFITFLLQEC